MRKNVFNSGVWQMIQKHWVIAFVAMIAVGLGTTAGFAVQSSDPFGAEKDAVASAAAESTTTSATATRRVGLAQEQVLNFQTEHKLTTTMVDKNYNFPEVPFSEVAEAIQSMYGIHMLLDETASDDELREDTMISCSLKDVSLERALEILLRKHNATFVVRSGMVHVISMDCEGDPEFFETRIYDCTELSKALPPRLTEYVPARKKEEGQTEPVDTLTTLEKLVLENIQADSWSVSGTGDAILHEINGKLVVSNSGPVHRDIRRFLEYLKAEFVSRE